MPATELTPDVSPERPTALVEKPGLPSLYSDVSFWGMTVTQFFGAFNDNLFKQVILLLSISLTGEDQQGMAMLVFAAPFLMFTGYAGFLSDRLGKRGIVIACKVAEIVVMALGGLGFVVYVRTGSLWMLYTVLFFMGAQSAFFGPAKYGILPEMLRMEDLPRANGFILMTTFLAIIFGTVVAGKLLEYFSDQLWVASVLCVSIAIVGTLSSLLVRRVPTANPALKFEPSSLTVPPDMRQLLRKDHPLLMALLVSSTFWLLAGMVPSAVNALGKISLQLGDGRTSILTGVIGLGIALGCVLGGFVSRGKVDFTLIRIGSIGIVVSLLLLAIPAGGDVRLLQDDAGNFQRLPGLGDGAQWLGFWGSLPTLLLLGMFTGMFAVPLQVFLQSRPPEDKKGRMIAVMNQANWIGVLASAGVYQMLAWLIESQAWPRSVMFLFIAMLMLPVALFYHPKNQSLSAASAAQ